MEYTPQNSRLTVHTTREGVLGRVGHDLELEVGNFRLSIDGTVVEGEADPKSLRVIGANHEGELKPVSASDASKIAKRIDREVLVHREMIQCSGSIERIKLTYDGRVQSSDVRSGPDVFIVEIRLSDFGIEPVTAFFGALRVSDVVQIRLVV